MDTCQIANLRPQILGLEYRLYRSRSKGLTSPGATETYGLEECFGLDSALSFLKPTLAGSSPVLVKTVLKL